MNQIDRQYKELLEHILHFGVDKKDRTGTGAKSIFGWQIRHNMKEGFPLLTTKKMAWKTMVTELLWFLRGDTNIKFLLDYDCHIWDGDAYKNYTNKFAGYEDIPDKDWFINEVKTNPEFCEKFGELGPIYGKQWRSWKGDTWVEGNTDGTEGFYLQSEYIDQIQNLINEIKTNPDSRRLMVSAWNVGEMNQMVLPPCHYGFQIYTRELSFQERLNYYDPKKLYHNEVDSWFLDELKIPKRAISLMWNQRSVDTFLGLPFNIASYALLLEIIAKEVNMIPDELIGNLGDVHLYSNHIEQAKEQITRTPFELPKLKIKDEVVWKEYDCLPSYKVGDFTIENYQSHPSIKAPLSN